MTHGGCWQGDPIQVSESSLWPLQQCAQMQPVAASSPILVQHVLFAARRCARSPSVHVVVPFLSPLCSAALKGTWQSGFFDQGSFLEIMKPWAQTVVVGRARYSCEQGMLPNPWCTDAVSTDKCKSSLLTALLLGW